MLIIDCLPVSSSFFLKRLPIYVAKPHSSLFKIRNFQIQEGYLLCLFPDQFHLVISRETMEANLGGQPGMSRPPSHPQLNPFGTAFYGAGSGLIRGGLGAYGEKFLGSSSEFMQSNVISFSIDVLILSFTIHSLLHWSLSYFCLQ